MKINTITCHDVYNYGASLQAYALQQHLRALGHDVQIIDYIPDYLKGAYNFWYIPKNHRFYGICKKSRLFHLIYSVRLAPITYRTYGRIKPFKHFKKQFLNCTEVQYRDIKSLCDNPPVADLYIAGSDQIWNTNLPNGHDPAFYLNFGNKDTRRISYAASFAISQLSKSDEAKVKEYLSHLDAISVREKTGVQILESMGYNGENVLDPVFLLSKSDWQSLAGCKPIVDGKYILVYHLFERNKDLAKMAVKYSRETGLKIVSINDKSSRAYADVNVSNAGPIEFVNLINNAEYVMADSFHATAFSLILNKPFSVFYHNSNGSRIIDCLEIAGLKDCYNPTKIVEGFDWDGVNMRLKVQIEASKFFLQQQLDFKKC